MSVESTLCYEQVLGASWQAVFYSEILKTTMKTAALVSQFFFTTNKNIKEQVS